MKILKSGSTGPSVQLLQLALNRWGGTGLILDGIFGAKTQAAVKDYQKKNGLLLDGVAGDQTWDSLMGGTSQGQQTILPALAGAAVLAVQGVGKGIKAAKEAKAAGETLKNLEQNQPEPYVSGYEEQLEKLYGQITDRGAFRYDPAEDPAYQQYAKQYRQQGKLAMEDAMGEAAGLTGGYGSTYAQSAAQQAYENYLAKMQDVAPALQENAWQQYKAQGEALLKQYDLLKEQDDDAYDRWRNEVTAWQKAVDDAQSDYEYSASADLKTYQMLLDYYADKAAAAVKTLQSGKTAAAPAVSSIGNMASLSSIAGESLARAMGNYLKNGKSTLAKTLYDQYRSRMTPNQQKNFSRLFAKYGVTLG